MATDISSVDKDRSQMRACVLIPARYASSRFPGKPLARLLGKPMIHWVAEIAAKAVGRDHVFVVTDDKRILHAAEAAGYQGLMTDSQALTGTDRIAEAAEMIDYDIYVNVQGDEPTIDPADITRCVYLKSVEPELIINGYCPLSANESAQDVNIPKVVKNGDDIMVYMSRSAVPGSKTSGGVTKKYLKQVCIYGFSRRHLRDYAAFGRKGKLEAEEDIEILRFLEIGHRVKMFECSPGSVAVDDPSDVARAEDRLRALGA